MLLAVGLVVYSGPDLEPDPVGFGFGGGVLTAVVGDDAGVAPAGQSLWMSLPWLRVVAGRRNQWYPSTRRVLLMQQCY